MSQTHLTYRPDIDGLRALAVSLVVVFHAFPQALPGGFIGVDVFFVISGFLITSIIQKDLAAGNFSFTDFYIKRIRRLLPSLIVVLFSVLVVGWISLLAEEYRELGKHTVGGTTFLSNFLLSRGWGYFDIESGRKPLLHLWSLGVEEQFYLLWPVCLFLIWRYKKTAWVYVLAAILASLAYENAILHTYPNRAFYFPMSRFWELMAGAFLATFPFRSVQIDPRFGNKFANFRSVSGMGLILLSAFLMNEKLSYPGMLATLPVLGAVLFISAGPQVFFNRRLFSSRAFLFFGTISYPLYLWHWPLISFAYIMKPAGTSAFTRAGLMVLAVLLAWGTYTCVEKRFRFGANARIKAFILLVALAGLGVIGSIVFLYQGFEKRSVIALNDSTASMMLHGGMELAKKQCGVPSKDAGIIYWCFEDARQAPKFAVWGDSHADALYWGLLRESGPDQRWRLLAKPSCAPMLGVIISDECDKYNQIAINSLVHDESISTVLVTGSKAGISDTKYPLADGIEVADDQGLFGISQSIQALMNAGKAVIFVIDNPRLPPPMDCVSSRLTSIGFFNKALKMAENSKCEISFTEQLRLTHGYRNMVAALTKKFPTLQIYDPLHLLCDIRANKCSVKENGQFLYSYGDHISDYANEMLAKEIIANINAPEGGERKGQFHP